MIIPTEVEALHQALNHYEHLGEGGEEISARIMQLEDAVFQKLLRARFAAAKEYRKIGPMAEALATALADRQPNAVMVLSSNMCTTILILLAINLLSERSTTIIKDVLNKMKKLRTTSLYVGEDGTLVEVEGKSGSGG